MSDVQFIFIALMVLLNCLTLLAIGIHSLRTRDMVRRLDAVILQHFQDGMSHR